MCVNISAIDKLSLVINYFLKYNLLGVKRENFNDWLKVYDMICSKQHLTDSGFEKIKLIQDNMNSKRQWLTLESNLSIYFLFFVITFFFNY